MHIMYGIICTDMYHKLQKLDSKLKA